MTGGADDGLSEPVSQTIDLTLGTIGIVQAIVRTKFTDESRGSFRNAISTTVPAT